MSAYAIRHIDTGKVVMSFDANNTLDAVDKFKTELRKFGDGGYRLSKDVAFAQAIAPSKEHTITSLIFLK